MGLPDWLVGGVRAATGRGMRPYKVQAEVIAVCDSWGGAAAQSSNLLALAANGSGKTIAFGIPALKAINFALKKPQVLILSKTLEGCLDQNKARIDSIVALSNACADSPHASYSSILVEKGRFESYPGIGGDIVVESQLLFGKPAKMAQFFGETVAGCKPKRTSGRAPKKVWKQTSCDLSNIKLIIVDEADEIFADTDAGKKRSQLELLKDVLDAATAACGGVRPHVLLMTATFQRLAVENFTAATRMGSWLGPPTSWGVVEVNQRGGCTKTASWDGRSDLLKSGIAGNNQCIEFELRVGEGDRETQFKVVKATIGACPSSFYPIRCHLFGVSHSLTLTLSFFLFHVPPLSCMARLTQECCCVTALRQTQKEAVKRGSFRLLWSFARTATR